MKLCYVASVYSQGNASKSLMQKRYEFVRDWVAKKFNDSTDDGMVLFSPIVHNHPLATVHDLPKTWDFWRKVDVTTLRRSDLLIVLKMPGWENSVGIQGEIDVAKNLSIPIVYIDIEKWEYKES